MNTMVIKRYHLHIPQGSQITVQGEIRVHCVICGDWCHDECTGADKDTHKADSHIACRAHAVPLPRHAAKG